MGDINGLLLTAFTFMLCTLHPRLRADRNLLLAFWVTLCVRFCAALIDVNLFRLVGSMGDDLKFHALASDFSKIPWEQPYSVALQAVYSLLGSSRYLGACLGVVAYSLTAFTLLEIAEMLGYARRHLPGLVLLFGLLPSAVIHESLSMRESYQCLTWTVALLCVLRFRQRFNPVWLLLLLCADFAMVQLHNALGLYAAVFSGCGLAWALRSKGQISTILLLCGMLALPLVGKRLGSTLAERSEIVQQMQNGTLLTYTETYRKNVGDAGARTEYGIQVDTGSLAGLALTGPLVFFEYMFAPMPWQIGGVLDIYSFSEALLRGLLLFCAWRRYQAVDELTRSNTRLIACAVLGIELLWSTGTTNWGTATRHHLVASAGFCVLGADFLLQLSFDPRWRSLSIRRSRSASAIVYSARSSPIGMYGQAGFRAIVLVTTTLLVSAASGWQVFHQSEVPDRSAITLSGLPFLDGGRGVVYRSRGVLWLPLQSGLGENSHWTQSLESLGQLLRRKQVLQRTRSLLPPLLRQRWKAEELDRRLSLVELNRSALNRRGRGSLVLVGADGRAEDPVSAQALTSAFVACVQQILLETATEGNSRQLQALTLFIREAEGRAMRLQAELQRVKATTPDKDAELERSLRRLRDQVAELEDQLNESESRWSEEIVPLEDDQALNQAEFRLQEAERIFQSGSQRLRVLRSTVTRLRRERATSAQALSLARQKARETILQPRRRLLVEARCDLIRVRSLAPSARDKIVQSRLELEVETWEHHLVTARQQLLQLQVEKQKAAAQGYSEVLELPLSGTVISVSGWNWNKFQRWASSWPLGFLAGWFLLVVLEFATSKSQNIARWVRYCDMPVVATLPAPQRLRK